MWSWTIRIGSSLAAGSTLKSYRDIPHDIFDTCNLLFSKSNDIDLLFGILSTLQELFVVKQIIEFSTIDFIEWHVEFQILILIQKIDYVKWGQQVESGNRAILSTHHSEGLSTTCLTISEASRHRTFESLNH